MKIMTTFCCWIMIRKNVQDITFQSHNTGVSCHFRGFQKAFDERNPTDTIDRVPRTFLVPLCTQSLRVSETLRPDIYDTRDKPPDAVTPLERFWWLRNEGWCHAGILYTQLSQLLSTNCSYAHYDIRTVVHFRPFFFLGSRLPLCSADLFWKIGAKRSRRA